jgi:hypothetical protein
VARVSVGGAFHLVSLAAAARAAREVLDAGTHGFWDEAIEGIQVRKRAFS